MTLISVIIPVYNKANYIKATLESVFNQNFTDYEVIAVNDGSTDSSLEVLQSFGTQNLRIINQKNQGLSVARNTGMAAARGQLIALLDADDLWLPEHLNQLVDLAHDYPEAQLFGTAYEELFKDGTRVLPKLNLKSTSPHFLIEDFFQASLFQPIIAPSSFGFKKAVLTRLEGFTPGISFMEDVDFYIRANLHFQMAYHTNPTLLYRFESENQITQNPIRLKKAPDLQAYLKANPNHESLKQYINKIHYFLCNLLKTEGAIQEYQAMKKRVNTKWLNPYQRFLLATPAPVLRVLRQFKNKLLKKGVRLTSF